jgi:DNA-directed RNA polymerase subunit RPC12/RpoP
MGDAMITRYLFYLLRWQVSTPILAFCVILFARFGNIWATVIANFIGGLIFFWIDRYIFLKNTSEPLWGIKRNTVCSDCGAKIKKGYRLVYTKNYDRTKDKNPEFRCESCSEKKLKALIKNGVTLQ